MFFVHLRVHYFRIRQVSYNMRMKHILKFGRFDIFLIFEISLVGALVKVSFPSSKCVLYWNFNDVVSGTVLLAIIKHTRFLVVQGLIFWRWTSNHFDTDWLVARNHKQKKHRKPEPQYQVQYGVQWNWRRYNNCIGEDKEEEAFRRIYWPKLAFETESYCVYGLFVQKKQKEKGKGGEQQ